jgi:hypothetical protein
MFLSDGGLAKTKTAKSAFAGLFTCDRWVLNFNDRVLTRLRPTRKKLLTIDEVQGPIFEGAISYFAKRLKTGETTIHSRILPFTLGGRKAEFRIVGTVIFFKYLFLGSPRSKLFALSELRRNRIPCVCVTTDADGNAIKMVANALGTDCIFGFTEKTLDLISERAEAGLTIDRPKCPSFEEGISVPSVFSETEEALSLAARLLGSANPDAKERDALTQLRKAYRGARKIFYMVRASSLPATQVLFYSGRLLPDLATIRMKIGELASDISNSQMREAAAMLEAGLAVAQVQTSRTEKTEAIRSFLNSNPDFVLVTMSKPEASVAADFFEVHAESMREIADGQKLLFPGLYSTWKFLDAVRRTNPLVVKLIGWSSEVELYEQFREKYLQASQLLYERDIEVAKLMSGRLEGHPVA